MSGRYSSRGSAAVGTNKTILGITAATTKRGRICEIIIGCSAAPADQAADFLVGRYTAAGTSTAFTPVAVDPADPAALLAAGAAHSVEPTYTANAHLLEIPLNQRNTFRWIASPGGELLIPATSANGIGVYSSSATGTAAHQVHIFHEE